MKLAVTLLTLCCLYVSLSQQQYMARRYPLPLYYNSYNDDSSPQQLLSRNHLMMAGRQQAAPFFVVRNNYIQPYSSPSPPSPSFDDQIPMQNQLGDDGVSEDDFASDDLNEQVLARAPFRGLKNSLLDNSNKADGRLFFNNFFSLLRSITSTKTVLSTVTSTLTTLTVKTCASAAQFIGNTSATACRRRRSVEQIAALEQDHHFVIAPSQVQPLEVSAAPAQIRIQRDLSDGAVSSSAEIESSQPIHQQEDEDTANNNLRSKRQLRSLIVSSTLTITSYSLVPSTITKSVTLGIGGCAACVSCVPVGITIC